MENIIDPFDPRLRGFVEQSIQESQFQAPVTPKNIVQQQQQQQQQQQKKKAPKPAVKSSSPGLSKQKKKPKTQSTTSATSTPSSSRHQSPVSRKSTEQVTPTTSTSTNNNNSSNAETSPVTSNKRRVLIEMISKVKSNTDKQRELDNNKAKLEREIESLKSEVGEFMQEINRPQFEWEKEELTINKKVKVASKRFYAADILEIVGQLKGEEVMDRVITELDRLHTEKYSEEEIRINTNCPLKRKRGAAAADNHNNNQQTETKKKKKSSVAL